MVELIPDHAVTGRPLILRLLRDYYEDTGRMEFHYWDFRRWYYSGPHRRYRRDWHTIERLIRRAASEWGYLVRVGSGRYAKFRIIMTAPTSGVVEW